MRPVDSLPPDHAAALDVRRIAGMGGPRPIVNPLAKLIDSSFVYDVTKQAHPAPTRAQALYRQQRQEARAKRSLSERARLRARQKREAYLASVKRMKNHVAASHVASHARAS